MNQLTRDVCLREISRIATAACRDCTRDASRSHGRSQTRAVGEPGGTSKKNNHSGSKSTHLLALQFAVGH